MRDFVIYFLIIVFFASCDSEDAGNCFQTSGAIIQQEILVTPFNKILINEKIELIIKEGPTQKVILETGKNLQSDISIEVVNNQLIATNNNGCNFVRDYGITKVFVVSPNIIEIRNSSELTVSSSGILHYPSLTLLSEDYLSDYLNAGDFNLEVDNQTTRIVSNGISNFYLKGKTTNLNISFVAGDSRFEGKDLLATNIQLTNKSSNDMLVFPISKLEGDIYSVGDVQVFNTPPTITITEHYTGKLIFK